MRNDSNSGLKSVIKAVAFTSNERIVFLYYTVDGNNVKAFEVPIREYEEYIERVS